MFFCFGFGSVEIGCRIFWSNFFDHFRVFWGVRKGGGTPLRGHFWRSSCGGGPAGARKVVLGVLLEGFGAPFWEPRWPCCRYFRRRFSGVFWLRSWELFWMDFGSILGGCWSPVRGFFLILGFCVLCGPCCTKPTFWVARSHQFGHLFLSLIHI